MNERKNEMETKTDENEKIWEFFKKNPRLKYFSAGHQVVTVVPESGEHYFEVSLTAPHYFDGATKESDNPTLVYAGGSGDKWTGSRFRGTVEEVLHMLNNCVKKETDETKYRTSADEYNKLCSESEEYDRDRREGS